MFSYLHFNIPPYKTDRFGCENVKDEKTIELSSNAHVFNSTENNREGRFAYK